MGRLVIVSNRLPVTISEKKGKLNVRPSAGGLATGLNSLSNKYEIIWVGWPGLAVNKPSQKTAIRKILKELAMHPVFIDSSKFNNFYMDDIFVYSSQPVGHLLHAKSCATSKQHQKIQPLIQINVNDGNYIFIIFRY